MSFFTDVKEFHEATGLDVSDGPIDMHELHPHGPTSSTPLWRLRMNLVREEMKEFEFAMNTAEDLVDIADAICDLHVVLSGTSVSLGIDEDECFAEVHRSNMAKLKADGSVEKRDDGKILKPDTWTPPDLRKVIYGTSS